MTIEDVTPLRVFDFRQLPTSDNSNMSFSRKSEASFYGSDGYLYFAQPGYNLLLNSQSFNGDGWNQVGTSIAVTGSVAAADGSFTASRISEKTLSGEHRVSQNVTVVKGKAVTISIYVKAGTRKLVQFCFVNAASYTGGNPGVRFNLSTGKLISSSTNVISFQAIDSGNGWWRLRLTAMPDRGTASGMHLYILNDDNEMSFTGNADKYVYIWGAQYEQSSSLSAYTPTTTAPYFGLRYHYDLSDVPVLAGALMEPTATNLIRYSHNLDNIAWHKRNSTIVTSGTRSPDGTINAFKIREDAGNSAHYIMPEDALYVTTSTVYTFSAFLKASERKWAYFNLNGFSVHFDLVNGVVGNKNAAYRNAGIEKAGGGWYRCFAVISMSQSTISPKIGTEQENGAASYQGNGSSGILVWGAQFEKGSNMTSYIRTKGSAVTRGEDTVVLRAPSADEHDVLVQRANGGIWVKGLTGEMDVPTSASVVQKISFYDADQSGTDTGEAVQDFDYTAIATNTLVPIFDRTYMSQTPTKSWSLRKASNIKAPVFRFELRSGDKWSGDLNSTKNKERSEFYMKNGDMPYDRDVWLSYSIRIAPGATSQISASDFCYLGQFHATEDSNDVGAGPVLGLRLEGADQIVLYTASTLQNPLKTVPLNIKRGSGVFTRGTWHRIVMRIRFSTTKGQVQLWQNGREIVNLSNIGIGYPDNLGPYWKFGIYRMAKPETLVVEYANMELSYTSSLYTRVANPLTIA